jgi:tetratricopeptide (TPR) repeat protein
MISFSKLTVFCLTVVSVLGFCALPSAAQVMESAPEYTLSDQQKSDSLFFEAMKAKMGDDGKRAHEFMEAYVALRPKEAAGWYELSRSYLADKKIPKANETIKKAIAIDGENKWYKEQYARVLESNGQYKEAAETLQKLAKTEKYNAEYLFKAALLYRRAAKYKDAQEVLDQLIAKEGEEEQFLLQKEEIYLKQEDPASAALMIERLIAANPMEGGYYTLLAGIYESSGDSVKAAQVYKRALNILPDDPSIQYSLAVRSKINNDSAGYSENLKKMALNKSLDVEMQLEVLDHFVSESFRDIDKRKEALTIAEELSKQHPKSGKVAYSYGRILVLNAQPDKAVEQYKRSLEIDQSNINVWSAMLDIFTVKEKADSLKFYSNKALRLFPNQASMHYYNGLAAYNKEAYPEAITILTRAVDMLPDEDTDLRSRIYGTLGEIYNTTKEYKLSDESYRNSIKADPNNYFVLNNFSYFLSLRNENLEEAERLSRHTLELVPNEPTFMDTYGWILYKQGKYSKAREFIQKAIEKTPEATDGTLFDHMGDVLYRLDEKDKALEYWKQAKQKGTDNPLIDKKIQEQKLYE